MLTPPAGLKVFVAGRPYLLNAVDPEAWLADVLEKRVGGWPMGGIDDLMPWAPAFSKAGAVEQERSAA